MTKLSKVFSLAIQNFFRNAWLSLITLTIIIITLIAVNIMVSINYLKTSALISIEDWVDVTVSLKKNVTSEDVTAMVNELDRIPPVAEVIVRTPEENLEDFKRNNPELEESVLPALDENPLSYSLVIKAYEVDQYQEILQELETVSFAEQIETSDLNDLRDFIIQAEGFIEKFNSSTAIFTIIFLLIGAVVIFNTIRVSIFTHREEVGIMKLVGATNWFVRLPFMVETILYSLVATVLTFIIIYPLLLLSAPTLNQFFSGINVNLLDYYQANFWPIFLAQFAGITVLNLIATYFALRKYLRV